MNLCVNARDAMPKGGALTLSAQNVELTADLAEALAGTSAGPHVALSVADTGAASPPHVIGASSNRFFTTKLRSKGRLGSFNSGEHRQTPPWAIEVKSLPGRELSSKYSCRP